MKIEQRYWFEVPPYSVIMDEVGKVWDVLESVTDALHPGAVRLRQSGTPVTRLVDVAPHATVAMMIPGQDDAIANLLTAGLHLSVLDIDDTDDAHLTD